MNTNLQPIVSIVAGIAAIILFFPSFYKNIILPFLEYQEIKKSNFNLVGNWISTWEPKAIDELEWVDEKIIVSTGRFGKIIIKNLNNNEDYSFTCYGKIYKSDNVKFIYGNWFSNSSKDDKQGRFLLTINPVGYMIGNFFGPNTQGVMMSGGWILGTNLYHLEYAKLLYKKGFVSPEEMSALKELKLRHS